tara:strand:- start:4 stop:900 length:897 start_codon:yes stop_codon:yes gene_type:complete
MPLFIIEGSSKKIEVESMPGTFRYTLDELVRVVEDVHKLSVPLVALFPCLENNLKTHDGSEALNQHGLIPRAIKKIKNAVPEIGIMTDIALDPYTTHGQDGLIDKSGYVLNDETNQVLCQQAKIYAEAGTDIVAPSDMMDGRIGRIRNELENHSFVNTKIMAYTAKYASSFYGPFRDAVNSKLNKTGYDKKQYQMDMANKKEALREAELDLFEGADMLLVKPGLPYLDILENIKSYFNVPTFAYQVSGEYSMIKAASKQGWINEKDCVLESLSCFKRAGADGIVTYFAEKTARWLQMN